MTALKRRQKAQEKLQGKGERVGVYFRKYPALKPPAAALCPPRKNKRARHGRRLKGRPPLRPMNKHQAAAEAGKPGKAITPKRFFPSSLVSHTPTLRA